MKYSIAIYLFAFSMLTLPVKSSPSEMSDEEQYQYYLDGLNDNGVSYKKGIESLCSEPGYVCVQVHAPTVDDFTKYNMSTILSGTMQCNQTYSIGTLGDSTTGYTGTCVGKAPLEILMTCSKGGGDKPSEEKGWIYINFSIDEGIDHYFDAREEASARFGLDEGNPNQWTTFDRSATYNQVNLLCPDVDDK